MKAGQGWEERLSAPRLAFRKEGSGRILPKRVNTWWEEGAKEMWSDSSR